MGGYRRELEGHLETQFASVAVAVELDDYSRLAGQDVAKNLRRCYQFGRVL